jgi:crotonobetainyl-CoA:carnitine CoA-transferase CaiB-like acyl-CoA transferase
MKTIHAEGIGDLKLFNLTAKFDKTPGSLETPPPRLSQHTEEILRSLGYTEEQIQALRKAGTV